MSFYSSFYKTLAVVSITLILASCGGGGGGGGGSSPFFLTATALSFSVNEDDSYSGKVAYSTNGTGSITIQLGDYPTNGTLTLTGSGDFSYTPDADFSGTDSFTFKAYSITKTYTSSPATVSITVNAVNDKPELIFDSPPTEQELLFPENGIVKITGTVTDNDSDRDLNTYSATINYISIPVTAKKPEATTMPVNGDILDFELDVSSIIDAGYFPASIQVCDADNACSEATFSSFFTTNNRTEDKYKVYNLMGSYDVYSDSRRNTDMLILSDSAENQADVDEFRRVMLKSINLLLNSSATQYFEGFFNVMIVEPINPDGSSFVDLTADGDCVDWSDEIFCWDNEKLSALEELLFPNIFPDVTALIPNLEGRGVTSYDYGRPPTMVQGISERTHRTFAHELGHAHAYLGDEYSSDGEREYTTEEITSYTKWDVNLDVESDPASTKWKHFINDLTMVPGYHSTAGQIGTGLFEGSYYSEEGSYRPQQYSIMGCSRCEDETPGCWTTAFAEENCSDYINVQAEGFALASTENLFRDAFGDTTAFEGDADTGYTGLKMKVGIVDGGALDTTKYKVEWYKDNVLDSSQNNEMEVIFDRPIIDAWVTYTWKIKDTTGIVLVPDLLDNENDCYLGLFDRSTGTFNKVTDGFEYQNRPFDFNDQAYEAYNYGYTDGCTSGTLMINWSKYQ